MDSEDTPNSFSKEVTTKDGTVKTVVAQSQAELDEAIKAVKNDELPVAPDINNPDDGNRIVSPDNLAVEPPYVQPEEPTPPEQLEEEPVDESPADFSIDEFTEPEKDSKAKK